MPRLHREKLAELLVDITAGDPPAGQMLPKETDLAVRFGVSRGVVRECVRALEERGVVRVKHGRGATVAPLDDWNLLDAEVLRALLRGPGAKAMLLELIEARQGIEGQAASLAAGRATEDDVREVARAAGVLAATPASAREERGRAEIALYS